MSKLKQGTAPSPTRSGMADAAEAIARATADAAMAQHDSSVETPTVAEPKQGSPKKKSERGCPEGHKTTWVTFNNDPATHAMLLKVAKKRGTNIDPMLSSLLKAWLDDNRKQLEAEAAEWDLAHPAKGPKQKPMDQMDAVELEAYMAALEKQIADVQALAAAKRLEVSADVYV